MCRSLGQTRTRSWMALAGLLVASWLAPALVNGQQLDRAKFPVDPVESMKRFDFWDNRDFEWFAERAPVLETPDSQLDEIWWYRWELVTKHLVYGSPEDGWASTEFIDRPFWSGTYGAISCPAGLQIQELRWLNDPQFAQDYTEYWFRVEGAQPRRYSTWLADAALGVNRVHPDREWIIGLLDELVTNYRGWEAERFDPESQLFWQIGHDDGMETNINSRQTPDWFRGAPAFRPTLNAYMYADALAIAQIARWAERHELATEFDAKAQGLKERMQELLWDADREFFFPMSMRDEELDGHVVKRGSLTYQTGKFAGSPYGRELIGYVPWQFDMVGEEYASAWKTLFDPEGFRAEFGPTTVERRDPLFLISANCCVWSGQSWPYATSQTLKALANVLQHQEQNVVDKQDYWDLLSTFVRTHRKAGKPFLAEAAHPDTGSWDGHNSYNHSEHYFHSCFCDLVVTGLMGVQERNDGVLELMPLVPDEWDYFLLQDLPLQGHLISLVWDRTGERYGLGQGFVIWVDGQELHRSAEVGRVEVALPAPVASPQREEATNEKWVNFAVNNHGDYYPRAELDSDVECSSITLLLDGQGWDYSDPVRAWTVEPGTEEVSVVIDLGRERDVQTLVFNALERENSIGAVLAIRVEYQQGDEWIELLREEHPGTKDAWSGRDVSIELSNRGPFAAAAKVQRWRVTFTRDPLLRLSIAEIGLWGISPLPYPAPPAAPKNLAMQNPGEDWPRISASHTSRFDRVEMANDGEVSFRPGPHNRWTSYESESAEDWLMVQWQEPVSMREVELGIYDDRGGVQAPESFRVEVLKDGEWQAVEERRRVPVRPAGGQFNLVEFEPIEATALRVIFIHRTGSKSGVTELMVR